MAWLWLHEPGLRLPNEAVELVMEYSAPTHANDLVTIPTAPNYRERLVGVLSSGLPYAVISLTSKF